ncbi:MAG TPA: hypothetical protein VHS05_15165, partial [Pyrinomonadaceae bacterium]|nr:hypothetical protein [Pyrinomonadaceae bacterium]
TPAKSKSAAEKSRKVYDQQVLIILRQIWMILDYICGKRLVAIMPEVISRLEYFGELIAALPQERQLLCRAEELHHGATACRLPASGGPGTTGLGQPTL